MDRRKIWVAYVAAMGMWGVLSYATLFQYMAEGTLFARTIGGRPYVSDFVNTYNAAKLSAQCLHQKVPIYDLKVQDDGARKLIAPVVPEEPFYLQYPPTFFALVTPLAAVSMPVAWLLWNLLCVVPAVFCVRWLTRGLSKPTRVAASVLAFAAYPAWLSFQLGQTSELLFVCVAGMLYCFERKRFLLAGLLVGLLSIKLQYLPAFGLIGLIAGGLPFLAGCAIAGGALLANAWLILGTDNILAFPRSFLSAESSHGVSGVNVFAMQNFRGFLFLLAHGETPLVKYGAVIFFALALCALGFLWWRYYRVANDRERLFRLLASLSVLIALISSLHAHVQDYLMATIPCIWLIAEIEPVKDAASKLQRLISQLVVCYPAVSWLFWALLPLFAFLFIQPFFMWAVILAILNYRLLIDCRGVTQAPSAELRPES